jgi:hypothetical protein
MEAVKPGLAQEAAVAGLFFSVECVIMGWK